MSVVPQEWASPGSLKGTVFDSSWAVLALAVFGFSMYRDGSFVEATGADVPIAIVVGPLLAVIFVYAPAFNDRVREIWQRHRWRFFVIVVLIFGVRALLALAPVTTRLTGLACFAVVIPVRTYVYLRAR